MVGDFAGLMGWVYPRTGGGNPATFKAGDLAGGLSPHGRGKHPHGSRTLVWGWSIPARAGETGRRAAMQSVTEVYPRTGGGNRVRGVVAARPYGLSPHGRGKHCRAILST